jgi:hypothetical protein
MPDSGKCVATISHSSADSLWHLFLRSERFTTAAKVCPNCDREIHYGVNGPTRDTALLAVITAKENAQNQEI